MIRDDNAYSRLAEWVLAHRRLTWALVVVVSVLSAVLGLPPEVDSNLLSLLPDDDPIVSRLKVLNDEEGGLNVLSLTFRGEDPEVLDAYLDELQAEFEAMPDVEFAVHDLPEDLAKQMAVLQLDPGEIGELTFRLKGALALGPALNPVVTQRLMAMGPLTEKIARGTDNPMFRERDDGTGRLLVRPSTTSNDPIFARGFMADVDELLAEHPPEAKGLELLWMGGAYRHAVEDVEGIRSDLTWTSIGSGLVVLVLMILAFRSVRALVIVFPPLLVANLFLFAFTKLAVGPLNTYTSFASAVLFGLGIDFAVHLVGRYREYRSAGQDTEHAIHLAWAHTGPPCATAALTSAAGFLALASARFSGFTQLGILLSVGLLACLLAMLVMLPLLLHALDHETKPLLGTVPTVVESTSTYQFAPPGVGLVTVLTVAIAAFAVPQLGYEYDMSALRRDGMAYEELSDEERQLARASYSPIVVFFDGAPDALQADQERLEALIQAGGQPHVAGVMSIKNVLPDDQAERNAQLKELVALLDDPNLRYLPPVLVKRLLPLRGMEVRELTRDDVPQSLLMLTGALNEDAPRMLVLPKGNMWDVRESKQLGEELEAALPGRPMAGEHLGISRMFHMAFEDFPRIAGLALVLVALLAWWDLKRPLFVVGAISTLIAGMIWAGGVLWLFGVKLTMINIAGVPILLGIGVDVVVHLLHRLEEEGPGGIRRALRTTGVAASISTLTTIGAFAALTLAGSRSIRSMGELVVIGLTVVFAITAFLLPLIWSAGWKLAGLAPGDQGAATGEAEQPEQGDDPTT